MIGIFCMIISKCPIFLGIFFCTFSIFCFIPMNAMASRYKSNVQMRQFQKLHLFKVQNGQIWKNRKKIAHIHAITYPIFSQKKTTNTILSNYDPPNLPCFEKLSPTPAQSKRTYGMYCYKNDINFHLIYPPPRCVPGGGRGDWLPILFFSGWLSEINMQ